MKPDVSKIRQAVEYERLLTDQKVKAHTDLTNAELETERKLREMAIAYERKYTDGQFGQLQLVAEEHRAFHEREHLLYEGAIEKASASLTTTIAAIQVDVDRFRDEASKWMTIERFDREHTALVEKTDLAIKTLADKIGAEEKVTVRQGAQQELLDKIATNNRWLIGVALTSGISLLALVAHLAKLY